MPLTQDEREKIHESEILRNEIRNELDPPKGSGLGKFLHDAALLVLGFVLTTVLGGFFDITLERT